MCSVGELRVGKEGSGPDLAKDDAGAAQCVEVLPRTNNDAEDDPRTAADTHNELNEP